MRFKKGRLLKLVNKLDKVQVMWLVRTRSNGTMSTKEVAEHLDISPRWVQKLCARYHNVELSEIKYPQKMKHPVLTLLGRTVQSAVLANHEKNRRNAVMLEKIVKNRRDSHATPYHRFFHKFKVFGKSPVLLGRYTCKVLMRTIGISHTCQHCDRCFLFDICTKPS